MSGKDIFIKKIEELLNDCPDFFGQTEEAEKALEFFNNFKLEKNSKIITENGLKILNFMQENYEKYNNVFKAREIGEGLFTTGRSVSGSMNKLVLDGYVEKLGKDPVTYSITEKGKCFTLT